MIPSILNECRGDAIRFSDEAENCLIEDYTCTGGVREVKTNVKKVIETLQLCTSEHTVSKRDVVKILGPAPISTQIKSNEAVPGRVNALCVNGNGLGSVSIIDVCAVKGEADRITGLLKDSAKESLLIAKTVVENYLGESLPAVHVHFGAGEGAIQKDGPSAGLSLVAALLSFAAHSHFDSRSAYTGELDIHGNIYPVGGVPQKIRGAIEAGCTKIFVPKANYERLSAEEKQEFSHVAVIPCEQFEDVLPLHFRKPDQIRKNA